MASPVVVVFLAGALWKGATERAALVCLWLSLLSAPFTLIRAILADHDIHFLPVNLENPMVFAGAYGLISLILMIALSSRRLAVALPFAAVAVAMSLWISAVSPTVMALALLIVTAGMLIPLLTARRRPAPNMWDRSMLSSSQPPGWYSNLRLWWVILGAILVGIYWKFW
jgi:hypothetical protein